MTEYDELAQAKMRKQQGFSTSCLQIVVYPFPNRNPSCTMPLSLGESPSWLRHRILIPTCEGSNPSSPAKSIKIAAEKRLFLCLNMSHFEA